MTAITDSYYVHLDKKTNKQTNKVKKKKHQSVNYATVTRRNL